MTFKAYITRDKNTGTEKGFEYPYEREAALLIAQRLALRYTKQSGDCALVANVATPPIDIVVITNNGLGIADLKNYGGPIRGSADGAWKTEDGSGNFTKILGGGSHVNPFQQVKKYRGQARSMIQAFVRGHSRELPKWMREGRDPRDYWKKFYIDGAVMFTTQKFDLKDIEIGASGMPWFTLRWHDEAPEWANSLSFGKGSRMTADAISLIATGCFGAEEWVELDAFVKQKEPFGYLRILDDSDWKKQISLRPPETRIGRSTIDALTRFHSVSRNHCVITKLAESVIITDENSKYGTWVNGERVDAEKGRVLKPLNKIVLGKILDNGNAAPGSCETVYRSRSIPVGATATDLMS